MSKKKREYEVDFKIDAARLVEDQGYTIKEAAERLGIPLANVTRWLRQYRNGQLVSGQKRAQATAEEVRVKELESEVKRLEMEVAILKKAATYFARQMT
jgi:transposase